MFKFYLLQVVIYVLLFNTINSLNFTGLVGGGYWQGRNIGQLHVLRSSINASGIEILPGGFLIYGGNFVNTDNFIDTWASSDSINWQQVTILNSYPMQPVSTFCSNFYTDQSYALEYGTVPNPSVWTTSNQSIWQQYTPQPVNILNDRVGASCFVDSKSNLYYIFGNSQKGNLYLNSWVSNDNGQGWKLLTSSINLPPRFGASTAVHYKNIHLDNKDIFYVLGGSDNTNILTDLWASSDGASWISLFQSFPWNGTQKYPVDFAISPDGILIANVVTIPKNTNGDAQLWGSLDGGYTWGLCKDYAEYQIRYGAMLNWDPKGILYVMSGWNMNMHPPMYTGDVWRSDISFQDWKLVASTCNLTLSASGVGLKSWPKDLISQ